MKKIILLFCLQVSFVSTLYAQQNLSSQALQDDAKLLWSALNELHPGLYRHNDTTVLEEKYQKLLADFSEDKTPQETFLLLSEFTTAIKCGHTYLNPFNQKNRIIDTLYSQKKLLPFTFRIIENQWVVYKSVSDNLKKGDIIVSINGNLADSIFQNITKYIKADGNRQAKKFKDLELTLTSKYEYFDYYFPMLYELENEVKLEVKKNGKETTETINIELLTKEERKAEFEKYFPLLTDNYDDLWKFKVENNQYAYLELGTFVTNKLSFNWKKYIDDAFHQINKQKIPHLIIDVRGNEGGNLDVTDYLIGKIANKKGKTVFRKPYLAYKEVSDSVKPHVTTWSKRFYNTSVWTKRVNEDYRTIKFSSNKAKVIAPKLTVYERDVYLLVDESNSSATFILAEICKENDFATLIGTTTGGTKKGITAGQLFFLTLPNSNIEVDIPLIGRYPIHNLADEGIEPNIEAKETLDDFIALKDKALDKATEVIEQVEKDKKDKKEELEKKKLEKKENQE
jgi:C-terminal processing protease CtpA/Prc